MNIDAPSFKQAMRECAGAVALVTVGTAPGQRTVPDGDVGVFAVR